jgi:hypothetical protein
VMVGAEHSEVQDGQVVRDKVPCDGGKMRPTSQQASKSPASAFRLQSADVEPTLYARTRWCIFQRHARTTAES